METTITKAKFLQFSDALLPLMKFGEQKDALRSFTIPVGPLTSVSVIFRGPMHPEHFERLATHITAFKTLFVPSAEPLLTRAEAKKLLEEIADRVFSREAQP